MTRVKALAALGLNCCGMLAAFAGDLTVRVSGLRETGGEVGCALFRQAEGFPMESNKVARQWVSASEKEVACRFAGLPSGDYAVSVSHDRNGNRVVDTNVFGIPIEAWGVSNNVRPLMRAPRWSEAAFSMAEGKDLAIDIKVGK